jgi:Putative zinc-finger
MRCEQVLRDEIAERYLRGALSAADQEAFEDHYFECASCFDELENLRLIREALAGGAAAGEARSGSRAGWAPWKWAAAAAVVALVAGGLYWRFVSSNGPPARPGNEQGRLAERQPAVRAQPAPVEPSPSVHETVSSAQQHPSAPSEVAGAAARSAALAALAAVQAPQYTPPTLRGALDEAERRFREAMRLYVRRDYAGAKAGLSAAAGLDRERPDIAFFLGICELLTDEPMAAIGEMRRTIALGESPYVEEAHFYLAKAHVRRGELAAAASELAATIRLRGEREQEARELLKKIEGFRRASP